MGGYKDIGSLDKHLGFGEDCLLLTVSVSWETVNYFARNHSLKGVPKGESALKGCAI